MEYYFVITIAARCKTKPQVRNFCAFSFLFFFSHFISTADTAKGLTGTEAQGYMSGGKGPETAAKAPATATSTEETESKPGSSDEQVPPVIVSNPEAMEEDDEEEEEEEDEEDSED